MIKTKLISNVLAPCTADLNCAAINAHLVNTLGLGLSGINSIKDANRNQLFMALSLAALYDAIMPSWRATNDAIRKNDSKKLCYFSMEFLMGRVLSNNLINLQARDNLLQSLKAVGIDINAIENTEKDAGLGNGGLGRLAACFLDSLATLRLPATGYGLLYELGFFKQQIWDGHQVELPDEWMEVNNFWGIKREDETRIVKFFGNVERKPGLNKRDKSTIKGYEHVSAIPFDIPIVGFDYKGKSFIDTLRLFKTTLFKPNGFSLIPYQEGDYEAAYRNIINTDSAAITAVLYPNDSHWQGKELRLKQQFFLVSAGLQDIIVNFKKNHDNFEDFPKKVALQINDTHPSLIIPELMRILVDEEDIPWDKAWEITQKTVNYTNHTILPEALEKWDIDLMRKLLPRQVEIIEEINESHLSKIRVVPCDVDRIKRLSIIDGKDVNMARLAIVGSSKVNGVSQLHARK
ncbi:MAG: glycogen/starch/alpha-glucan phosphorylase, partial [Candidatus Margulisbacteria bacterium]|nr:glycogen/starch/alpha-glucan phosphorylase [Candidatus Margulisiibacteriota bacterium]